ncbi:MAG: SusC/RagA family TonB-linked outer membrane protein, partial [Bacteroidota bacterium]|nr:SusC/RagA family TonB-linked outer membrane protein [Bacteroidota bacterium]
TYTAQVPPFVNPSIFTNVGSISNKGVEVQVSAIPVRTKDFTWNTDVVWSQQRNKLVSISNEQFRANFLQFGGLPSPGNLGSAIRSVEGLPLGNFYGKRFAGFDANGKWLFYKHDGKQVPASQINDSDLVVIGNGVPKMMASWNSTVSYRNFDLTLFFRGKFGFDILNTKDMYFGNKAWLPNNLLRSAVTTHNQLNDAPQYSDYYLEKGDFVKLDNVTLGYNLKPGSRYVRNVRIYATARNLLTFTGYSGIDPELQDTGLTTGIDDRGFYPRTKSYAIGLNVGF